MKKNDISILFAILILLCLCGCNSTKAVSGSGTSSLVIMIIDENNKAVNDYQLVLTNAANPNQWEKRITESEGMCVFNSVLPGQYFIEGRKNNYTQIEKVVIEVSKRGEVFCFEVCGGQALFQKVEDLYALGMYEEGLAWLDKFNCEQNTLQSSAIHFFKAYGFRKIDDELSAAKELVLVGDLPFLEVLK